MTDPHYKPFSEYREKDYRTPRTIKQAYGYDTYLYTNDNDAKFLDPAVVVAGVVVVCFVSAAVTVFLWVI